MWKVSAEPQRFAEATTWFRNRVPMTADEWRELEESARRKAFTVANVAQLDLVNDVYQALEKAIEEGQGYGEFQEEIAGKLEEAWRSAGVMRTCMRVGLHDE